MHSVKMAATLLNVTEYKLFADAYLTWFGDHADQEDMLEVLSQFMMFGEVPDWADQFARTVLADLEANRQVNLTSFSLLNLSPRTGNKPDISFSIVR